MIYQLEHHFILFSIIFLIIGYLLGSNIDLASRRKNEDTKIDSFFKQQKKQQNVEKNNKIDIDNSTHVVKINTDNLEKRYSDIGQKQSTTEDISASINKLKNLKK